MGAVMARFVPLWSFVNVLARNVYCPRFHGKHVKLGVGSLVFHHGPVFILLLLFLSTVFLAVVFFLVGC
jgi:hypothetical protein